VADSAVLELEDRTLRQVVHLSLGGEALTVRLSNEFGHEPLEIAAATVAKRAPWSQRAQNPAARITSIVPGTERPLTFSGRRSLTLAAGALAACDDVELVTEPGEDLVVALHLPGRFRATTVHATSFQSSELLSGDLTEVESRPGHGVGTPTDRYSVITQWWFLAGVAVRVAPALADSPASRAVVAFGDSITDGSSTSVGANHRWPDRLAELLRSNGREPHGVVNAGIGGNRLLHDPNPPPGSDAEAWAPQFGPSGLNRFDRDVLTQPGATATVVLLGINDLGQPGSSAPESETVTAQDLIIGHRDLVERARRAGLAVIGGTLLPCEGSGFFTGEREAIRQEVNDWIRAGGEYDAVADFDQAARDPASPTRLTASYDSGDHLHPNDTGMLALASAVPLDVLLRH
jgi:lysophospholipase L1-like esterase